MALELARQRLASILGCTAEEIVFTSGATEACNTVWAHVAHTLAQGGGRVIWLSSIEHPAVFESARHFFGPAVRAIPVDGRGVVALEWMEARLREETPVCVAVMAANNETGVLQPWARVQEICVERDVKFFCDATQWCGRLPGHGLGAADFLAGSAHKFGGPRGVGFLKTPRGARVVPLLRGGKQQDGRRAGTENVPGVLAMVAALEWCERQMTAGRVEENTRVRQTFENELIEAIPNVIVHGAGADRLWNTVSVRMPQTDCRQRWVVQLDKRGFAVSTGSACASAVEEPSPVLSAMGLSAAEAARALRFSGNWETGSECWRALLQALVAVHREKTAAPAERRLA